MPSVRSRSAGLRRWWRVADRWLDGPSEVEPRAVRERGSVGLFVVGIVSSILFVAAAPQISDVRQIM